MAMVVGVDSQGLLLSPPLTCVFWKGGLDGGVWQSKDRWGVRLRSAMFGVVQRGNVRVAVATCNFLKRYPEPHGQVTAYNRSPVH